jgi:hypothetical protein
MKIDINASLRSHQVERSESMAQHVSVDTPQPARACTDTDASTLPGGEVPMSCLNGNEGTLGNVYEALRDHQQQASEKLRLLHTYLLPINNRFFGGKLPLPALSWDTAHWRSLASHREQDGLALHHRINLNLLYADRPIAEILRSLAHELCHLWQNIYGHPPASPGPDNYHNSEFRRKMQEAGIPCNKHGVSLGMEEPFVSFLKEVWIEADATPFKQEVEIPQTPPDGSDSTPASRSGSRRSGSRLKPWACKCSRAKVWASIKVELNATCYRCGSSFQRQ